MRTATSRTFFTVPTAFLLALAGSAALPAVAQEETLRCASTPPGSGTPAT